MNIKMLIQQVIQNQISNWLENPEKARSINELVKETFGQDRHREKNLNKLIRSLQRKFPLEKGKEKKNKSPDNREPNQKLRQKDNTRLCGE